jgi:class III poly(R)-hydroxyalkanoic acid synthase PhaE subunit
MTEQKFWNNDWMAVQQKYWENWTEMSRKAMGMAQPAKSPWEQGMEHWWQAVAPAAPDVSQDFMGKMMEQGKQFFRMAEDFARNLQANGGTADWNDVLNKTFSDLQQSFAGTMQPGGDDALHKMMAFWEMPLDNWQRMLSSLSLVPGDVLRNMPHGGPQENLNRFLSAPGLGYAREEQGQQQKMLRLLLEYQKAMQEYMQFFSNLGLLSVDRMRQRVGKAVEDGETIDSARALYDNWVSCCEEVYGEQVMTPEYAQIHGHLVNSLMGVKKQMGAMVDEFIGALNMPTRAELRTLQERMQENRREIKQLRAEMTAMKAQMAGQPAAGQGAARATPKSAARKVAPKRKTAVKKAPAVKR